MTRHKRIAIGVLALVAVAVAAGALYRLAAQDRPAADDKETKKDGKETKKDDSAEMTAVRKTADAFAKAFNAGDARAVAAFWTKDGEYIGPDGAEVRGRDELEKSYVEFFKKHPKARIEVEIESVRLFGRYTAQEEGLLKLYLSGEKEPGVSRYSVVHVREEDGWRVASVREWVPDPAQLITVSDVAWLIGEWTAKSDEADIRITYAWDEDKAFLHGRYTLKQGNKVISSGTQIIGKNPAGGLRSWLFDRSGTYGESVWSRDEDRWIIEAEGTLPDGSEMTAVNILVPLGKDSFTWQSTQRTASGSELPDAPPLKVTRVKSDK